MNSTGMPTAKDSIYNIKSSQNIRLDDDIARERGLQN
jgi:hypothetical protein